MVSPAAFGFAHIRLCTFGNRWARGLSEQYRSIVTPVMALAARFVAGVLSGVASRTTRGFRPLSPQTQLGIRMFKNLLATKPIAPAGHVDAGEPFEGSRSEEHTSELQSLMRISYAVFCLKKKTNTTTQIQI